MGKQIITPLTVTFNINDFHPKQDVPFHHIDFSLEMDEDDWKKLKQQLEEIHGQPKLSAVISTDVHKWNGLSSLIHLLTKINLLLIQR